MGISYERPEPWGTEWESEFLVYYLNDLTDILNTTDDPFPINELINILAQSMGPWEDDKKPLELASNRLNQIKTQIERLEEAIERRRKLLAAGYETYLTCPEWKQIREEILPCDCLLCSNVATHIHHRHYDRIGFEGKEDLTPLCPSCHAKFHGKSK